CGKTEDCDAGEVCREASIRSAGLGVDGWLGSGIVSDEVVVGGLDWRGRRDSRGRPGLTWRRFGGSVDYRCALIDRRAGHFAPWRLVVPVFWGFPMKLGDGRQILVVDDFMAVIDAIRRALKPRQD